MVDVICEKSGIAPANFEKAIDHPAGDAENKPDFMLSCKEFDIVCEHKLDSDLGERQLERYLGLPKSRSTYLVLITSRSLAISTEVLQSSSYLRPVNSPSPFFYWEDFYPIIANHNERLAQDFVKYMSDIGLAPCLLPKDWVRLFRDRDVAEGFYETTNAMRSYFTQMGALCKSDPSRLGFQVQHPHNWLHLLYFYVSKVTKPIAVGIEPPYLIARLFVQKTDLEHVKHLEANDIPTEDGLIVGRVKNEIATWNKNLVLRYEYLGSLKNHLAWNTAETRKKLLGFGRTVFEHIASVPH